MTSEPDSRLPGSKSVNGMHPQPTVLRVQQISYQGQTEAVKDLLLGGLCSESFVKSVLDLKCKHRSTSGCKTGLIASLNDGPYFQRRMNELQQYMNRLKVYNRRHCSSFITTSRPSPLVVQSKYEGNAAVAIQSYQSFIAVMSHQSVSYQ